jgi:predicted metal-dependent phosphotriesterase family hydrolase
MAFIQTVLGPIKPENLGVCLPHEHIWCDQNLGPRLSLMGTLRDSGKFMRLNNFEFMIDELKAYKAAGGGAIVEVTCEGWGRDLDVLAKLSLAAEVHIIATSGFYIEPHIPYFLDSMSIEELADHISSEIEDQVSATGRRCGVFKSAIHRARVEGLELKVLQAVAIAQKRTGAAITTHTTGSRRMEVSGGVAGVEQLRILKELGVSPTRFIVGHVDERPDIDVLCSLAQQGCYIQFDVIGKEHYLLDTTRAELVHAMIQRGYLSHLMISQDRNRDHEMRFSGNSGYCHIFETFLPKLQKLGITAAQITTIMVENPAKALTIS